MHNLHWHHVFGSRLEEALHQCVSSSASPQTPSPTLPSSDHPLTPISPILLNATQPDRVRANTLPVPNPNPVRSPHHSLPRHRDLKPSPLPTPIPTPALTSYLSHHHPSQQQLTIDPLSQLLHPGLTMLLVSSLLPLRLCRLKRLRKSMKSFERIQ